LKKYGIIPVIITGRSSEIVTKRARELNITEVIQGVHDKVKELKNICEKYNFKLDDIAYIGDDENDLECMKLCSIKGCPADAVEVVKKASDFVCVNNGGNGAVREFIDYILNTL
jgi:3-deoxy-D-manno-octulosonate 8-phosphate phosphatase (KDO 8-P phosphatase)